ncbi:hypothetical protein [Herbiconiux liukaitaii]|uniref:hypothetical protein n=1 Tax=Herbiconiux liukaitaii TaxID=3342799 RepID=UPI0035B939C8
MHIYSCAPATAQQAALLESELTQEGFTSEPRADGLVYVAPYNPGTFILVTADAVFETNGTERFDELLPYRP